jgi:hypothetical protein
VSVAALHLTAFPAQTNPDAVVQYHATFVPLLRSLDTAFAGRKNSLCEGDALECQRIVEFFWATSSRFMSGGVVIRATVLTS